MLTGMSGAGKTTALRLLEDMGYFCVDNLPWQLLDAFVELCQASSMRRVAIGVDSRGGSFFDANRVIEAMHSMGRESGMTMELVYMDCAEEALIARYKETRRDHPMAKDRPLQSGIALERELLLPLKEAATHIIDTTSLSVRQLRQTINQLFGEETASLGLRVEVVSFGFKRGLPRDADMVFDVRFLPNPFYARNPEISGTGDRAFAFAFAPIYPGGQEPFDDRGGLHRRHAPFGGPGRRDRPQDHGKGLSGGYRPSGYAGGAFALHHGIKRAGGKAGARKEKCVSRSKETGNVVFNGR